LPIMALEGIYCPIITPFVDEQLALEKIAFNLEKLNATGLAGYVILGSTGEPVHLTNPEKIDVIKAARKHTPSEKKMIVGTGLESTRETVEFTKSAAELGADAVLVLTPHYYKGHVTADGVKAHYWTVAEKSPVPVILYNVPRFTGIELSTGVIRELSEHPNIIGIKESTGNLSRLVEVTVECSENMSVLGGNAELFLSGLMAGAQGGILAVCNIVPSLCVEIYELHHQDKFVQARNQLQRLMQLLHSGISKYGIPAIKAAMDMLGYYGGPPRPPLLPINDGIANSIKKQLEATTLNSE